jgi:hypothetical protein
LCNLQVTVRLGQTSLDKLSLNLEPLAESTPSNRLSDEGENKISFQLISDAQGPMLKVFACNDLAPSTDEQPSRTTASNPPGLILSPSLHGARHAVELPAPDMSSIQSTSARHHIPEPAHSHPAPSQDATMVPLHPFASDPASGMLMADGFHSLHGDMGDPNHDFGFDLNSMDAFSDCLASGFASTSGLNEYDPQFTKLARPDMSPDLLSPAMSGIMAANISSPSSTSSPFYLDSYMPPSASSDSAATSDSENAPAGPSRRACKRRRFSCSYEGCTRRFTSHYTLKLHQDAHKPKERQWYTCTAGCSEHFSRQHDRLRHEVAKHGKVCEWICGDCQRFFSSSRTLSNHKCPGQNGEIKRGDQLISSS